MKSFIVLAFALAAFAAPQLPTTPPANLPPAATECLSKCATTAFGVEATSLTPDTMPCGKEYAGPEGAKGAAFKSCICKDEKVKTAMTCQGKCQYGTVITYGFKSFCK